MAPKNKKSAAIAIFIVIMLGDLFIWREIFASGALGGFAGVPANIARDYFLDVGQGDSELIIFPGNIKVMTDAGSDDAVLAALARAMPPGDDYIDIAVISQPQSDDFNGYNFILDHYRVGAFIYNGRDDDLGVAQWPELKAKIAAMHIPLITLGAGDKIFIGAENANATEAPDEVDILSPNAVFDTSVALNDTGLVELVKTPQFRTLLTADIGANVEDWLLANRADIRADVLKVPDHGSQYSSGDAFLRAIAPRIAVIEVGAVSAKNKSDQPGTSTLARLASDTNALILRTDQDGTVEIYPDGNGKLMVVKEK